MMMMFDDENPTKPKVIFPCSISITNDNDTNERAVRWWWKEGERSNLNICNPSPRLVQAAVQLTGLETGTLPL